MLASRVAQSTATTGTSTYQLGTVPLGRVGAIAGYGNGGIGTFLVTLDGSSDWEIIWGVVAAGSPDTITRNLISSSTGALISWPSGTKLVQSIETSEGARFGNVGAVPVATGSANAIAVAHVPPMRVLRPGMAGRFYAGGSANTGNVTLALDGLSSVPLRRADGTEIGPGVIRPGMLVRWYAHSASEARLDETPVGMELLGSVAPSGTPTYVEFALPAGFATFVFDCANIKPNASAQLAFQLSLNGGSTWLTGLTDYSSGGTYNFSPNSTANVDGSAGLVTASVSNAHACRTRVELSPTIPGAVGSYFSSTGAGVEGGGTNYARWDYGGAGKQATTRPNRIRFFWSGGTTFGDIGRIAMMGVR